jgi:hypothetical protein
MDRLIHVIESKKGYLKDIEEYTDDILDAVTFIDYNIAIRQLIAVSGLLTEECWVGCTYIPFPRPTPFKYQT